ncbi:MAG: hypothetical protein EBU93_02215 [Chlamydiae bacterium]|jgi:YbgC/YbaW family acyl-CoA thioester hydrolase|nr:hypothetical protein [Chlamydiota bacterium]
MIYQRKIRVEDTDLTGVIFFPKLQAIGLECLEFFLNSIQFSVKTMMLQGFVFPIVQVQSNYFFPIEIEDELSIFLSLQKMGNSSVAFEMNFLIENKVVASMSLTHVLVDKISKKSVSIPFHIRELISRLPSSFKEGKEGLSPESEGISKKKSIR